MTGSGQRRLREHPNQLEVYATRIHEATGIPAEQIEKDFWVTEILRGAAAASAATGCSVVFKGGTSLSKAHRHTGTSSDSQSTIDTPRLSSLRREITRKSAATTSSPPASFS